MWLTSWGLMLLVLLEEVWNACWPMASGGLGSCAWAEMGVCLHPCQGGREPRPGQASSPQLMCLEIVFCAWAPGSPRPGDLLHLQFLSRGLTFPTIKMACTTSLMCWGWGGCLARSTVVQFRTCSVGQILHGVHARHSEIHLKGSCAKREEGAFLGAQW